MKIQRFEARDLQRALRLAQQALGPEAVILQTRRVPEAGLRGLLGGRRVEILAAVDIREESFSAGSGPGGGGAATRGTGANASRMPGARPEPGIDPVHRASEEPGARATGRRAPDLQDGPHEWELLRQEVADLRLQLAQPGGSERLPSARTAHRAPRTAHASAASRALERLALRPIEIRAGACTAVALVGPTGIGKTTTLAKLAAVAKSEERKRVAFVTVDTFRIGAVEQLETYARLQDIPLTVVRSPEEMRAARERYGGYDLLLVDTIGRPPRQQAQLQELAVLLQAARLDEVHLVLEARQSLDALRATLDGFRALRPTHLLLTKLDEAERREDALAAALEGGLPLSYVTTGQRVPEDLALAEISWLVDWARGGV
jgi:flagellar biosynthesis protein FlhF